jgi:hypothetical protein
MAHVVTCTYCKNKFDRDKQKYCIDTRTKAKRYLHLDCARQLSEELGLPSPEVVNPLDFVTCIYCKKTLNRNDEDCIIIREGNEEGSGRYAHKHCKEIEDSREKTDEEKLDLYIMQLFKTDYVPTRIQRQISNYIADYNFTYSGMHKALVYFYEIKGNSIEKSNGGIGIIPYIYKDAYNYYYSLWEAQQKNQDKIIESYVPKVKEIVIPVPQRNIKKRKLFTFLDEEEVEHGQ